MLSRHRRLENGRTLPDSRSAKRPFRDPTHPLLALPDPGTFRRETNFPVPPADGNAHLPVVHSVRAGAAAVFPAPADAGRDLAAAVPRLAERGGLGRPG